ncbi:sentrin-specific protease 5-like [Xyrichtys novacula]|uniref:Sentrin-specific protease 5-like n=1 Tax=Xyrichtys novacula TaxID=13765 RepID=A0AAV1GFV5_XYRNO|nr:sentrin-specific protease 5-like [Xyrichtys novacula]
MHRTQRDRNKPKGLKRKRRFMSSIKGVCHLSRRAKRRLYCKLQLWMWRRQKERYGFGMYRSRKQACVISPSSTSCLGVKTQSQKSKIKASVFPTPHSDDSEFGTLGLECANGKSEESLRGQNCLFSRCESVGSTETLPISSQNSLMDTNVTSCNVRETISSQQKDTLVQVIEMAKPSNSEACGFSINVKEERTAVQAQRPETNSPSGQSIPLTPCQARITNNDADETTASKKMLSTQADVSLIVTKDIRGFLDEFYRMYGSFIPLQKTDVLRHMKGRFNTDFNDWKRFICSEVTKYESCLVQKPAPSFRVVYKKHTLALDDLSTLADQNWLNDQVMNMYGELIMESTHHKVHFLNSFFHRQLMTKGYEGVKRWTKQVDLFSKSMLLVPIHLEVHWCLVSADIAKKKICIYDSQGNGLQKIARNILKYLMTEAKEKKQSGFENGWAVSFDEKVPQQTNENDCGVFVLEYSRCLALGKPLKFSQKDIPKIRKRIYKELCECRLREEG